MLRRILRCGSEAITWDTLIEIQLNLGSRIAIPSYINLYFECPSRKFLGKGIDQRPTPISLNIPAPTNKLQRSKNRIAHQLPGFSNFCSVFRPTLRLTPVIMFMHSLVSLTRTRDHSQTVTDHSLGRLFPMPQQLWNPFLHASDPLIVPLLYVRPFIDPFLCL
jgi:hypothetical protein